MEGVSVKREPVEQQYSDGVCIEVTLDPLQHYVKTEPLDDYEDLHSEDIPFNTLTQDANVEYELEVQRLERQRKAAAERTRRWRARKQLLSGKPHRDKHNPMSNAERVRLHRIRKKMNPPSGDEDEAAGAGSGGGGEESTSSTDNGCTERDDEQDQQQQQLEEETASRCNSSSSGTDSQSEDSGEKITLAELMECINNKTTDNKHTSRNIFGPSELSYIKSELTRADTRELLKQDPLHIDTGDNTSEADDAELQNASMSERSSTIGAVTEEFEETRKRKSNRTNLTTKNCRIKIKFAKPPELKKKILNRAKRKNTKFELNLKQKTTDVEDTTEVTESHPQRPVMYQYSDEMDLKCLLDHKSPSLICEADKSQTEQKHQTNVPNNKGSDERTLPCPVCSRFFKRKEHLTRHLSSHGYITPYKKRQPPKRKPKSSTERSRNRRSKQRLELLVPAALDIKQEMPDTYAMPGDYQDDYNMDSSLPIPIEPNITLTETDTPLIQYNQPNMSPKLNYPMVRPCEPAYNSMHRAEGQVVLDLKTCWERVPETKGFRCRICMKDFKRKDNLSRHLQIHANIRPHRCEVCSKSFLSRGHLTSHYRTHTNERPYLCEHCNKSFTEPGNYKKHLKLHSKERPYHCPDCTLTFQELSYLEKHRKIHQTLGTYSCKICLEVFEREYQLNKHVCDKLKDPFLCNICLQTFKTQEDFHFHVLEHQPPRKVRSKEIFKCEFCMKIFPRNAELRRHLRIHSSVRPFECEYCKKGFIDRSKLKVHLRIHTEEKPFSCNYCDKGFTQKSNLVAHIRRHTKERPFKCPVCSKAFGQIYYLREHERIHRNEKPFECNVCLKKFTQNGSLRRHQYHSHSAKTGADTYQIEIKIEPQDIDVDV